VVTPWLSCLALRFDGDLGSNIGCCNLFRNRTDSELPVIGTQSKNVVVVEN
jgi:hypothetical protein